MSVRFRLSVSRLFDRVSVSVDLVSVCDRVEMITLVTVTVQSTDTDTVRYDTYAFMLSSTCPSTYLGGAGACSYSSLNRTYNDRGVKPVSWPDLTLLGVTRAATYRRRNSAPLASVPPGAAVRALPSRPYREALEAVPLTHATSRAGMMALPLK